MPSMKLRTTYDLHLKLGADIQIRPQNCFMRTNTGAEHGELGKGRATSQPSEHRGFEPLGRKGGTLPSTGQLNKGVGTGLEAQKGSLPFARVCALLKVCPEEGAIAPIVGVPDVVTRLAHVLSLHLICRSFVLCYHCSFFFFIVTGGLRVYKMLHLLLLPLLGLVIAARMASSNTCFKPSCVRAEHSKYLVAPTSFA